MQSQESEIKVSRVTRFIDWLLEANSDQFFRSVIGLFVIIVFAVTLFQSITSLNQAQQFDADWEQQAFLAIFFLLMAMLIALLLILVTLVMRFQNKSHDTK